jgi:hypothetical protein
MIRLETDEPVWVILGRQHKYESWQTLESLIGPRAWAEEAASFFGDNGYIVCIKRGGLVLESEM